jgi:hypothetical protein
LSCSTYLHQGQTAAAAAELEVAEVAAENQVVEKQATD